MTAQEAVQNRIIRLCGEKRWAFNALANYSGIPSSTMKNIINGQSKNPGIVTIKKICDGLEITLGSFSIHRNLMRWSKRCNNWQQPPPQPLVALAVA